MTMPKLADVDATTIIENANYLLAVRNGVVVKVPFALVKDTIVITNAFTNLTDTPNTYIDQGGKLIKVNSGGTGLEFGDAPTSLPAGGTPGQVLTKNSAIEGDAGWADVVAEFTELSDVPNSYYGKGGKFLKVNSAATGVEFGDAPAGAGSSDTSSASKVFIYTHLEGGL